jgi:hypothetical protein
MAENIEFFALLKIISKNKNSCPPRQLFSYCAFSWLLKNVMGTAKARHKKTKTRRSKDVNDDFLS